MGTAVFPVIKWERLEVNHYPPTGAEIKNNWSYTSAPLYAFMVKTGQR